MSVFVSTEDIWSFYKEKEEALTRTGLVIADDAENGIEIFITEQYGLPLFVVEVDDRAVYQVGTVDQYNTRVEYEKLLRLFIETEVDDDAFNEDFYSYDDLDRLDEVNFATRDLVETFLEGSIEEFGLEEIDLDNIAFEIARVLYDEYGCSVRLPQIVENDDGTESVIQFPFGENEEEDYEQMCMGDLEL